MELFCCKAVPPPGGTATSSALNGGEEEWVWGEFVTKTKNNMTDKKESFGKST